jgi:uncharacterized Zn finger protein (UPF0148 family)
MYGFVQGYSDTDDISHCPYCGEEVYSFHADGSADCDNCSRRFAVVEMEDE